MISEDGVYDIKAWIPYHPGGELLIKHLLYTDATDHLTKIHPPYVIKEKLPNFFVGKIDAKTCPDRYLRSRSPISVAFREELETEMRKEKLWDPCYFYFIMEFVKVFFFLFLAFYIIIGKPDNIYLIFLASFFHAFANQQVAFILHDISHN